MDTAKVINRLARTTASSVKTKDQLYTHFGKAICDQLMTGNPYNLLENKDLDLLDAVYALVDPTGPEPFRDAIRMMGNILKSPRLSKY